MSKRTLYIAAYDVSCPVRLKKALFILKQYASGGQKSVFECYLSSSEKEQLLSRITQLLELSEDRFSIIALNQGKPRILGKAVLPADPVFYYVG